MLHDHRPYYLKKMDLQFRHWYVENRLRPQFAYLGGHHTFMKPWYVQLFGGPIRLGEYANVITTPDHQVRFTIWSESAEKGRITIGDYCLVCPGVRISSADAITIGNDCMVASQVYITDADWHGIYDRAGTVGVTRPVTIGDNVWLGDSVIVCKGVNIGDHSVIGAGSVVTRDIPAGVIAAGNPAKIIRKLDPDHSMFTRKDWFSDPRLEADIDQLDRNMLAGNTLGGWLRSIALPRPGD